MLIDILWLLFLCGLLSYFFSIRLKALQTRRWKKTEGRITACEWSVEGHRVWPKIQFTYVVDGREYTSEHLFLDTSHNTPNSPYSRAVAYRVAKAYKDKEPTSVYYNPEQPELAAIDTKIPTKVNFIILLLLGLIILHVGIMVYRLL